MRTQLLNFVCCLITFFVLSNTISAQEQALSQKSIRSILGKWEGNLVVNENKSVGILWNFEKSDQGKLIGFMGPASKGVATIPMKDIVISDSTISYSIHSEGSYKGQISVSGVNGTWSSTSGKQVVLYMARELTTEQLNKRYESAVGGDVKNDIHRIIKLGDVEAVKMFLDKGNDINKIYDKGFTLLFYAIKNDRTHKIAKYLLSQGANPNLQSKGMSPLMYAVGYRNYTILQELINHKAELNYVSIKKESALMYAIGTRDAKSLQLLLDGGADPKMKIFDNQTAIDLAKEENNRAILEVLNLPYQGVSDGPYIVKNDAGETSAIWVYKGEKKSMKINHELPQTIKTNGMKAVLWPENPSEVEKLEYNGEFKIAAISDIHGQYDVFIELLKKNRIIDENEKWNFGNGHFVVAGDMFDRGSHVTEVLWFLYDLEKQAEQNGGKLHVLLGNHDVMVLNGNLRSVHPKYIEIAKILDQPFNSLFNKGTVLGDWLRTRPVLVKLNNVLFTHGGLHPDFVNKGLSLNQINYEFKQQLIESELPEKRNELGNFLHRANGPIYYRGYFQGALATTKQIDQLLNHFKITNIVVGHTTHRHIESHYDGRVIVIDANMKSGKAGEILFWQSGEFVRGTLSGEKIALETEVIK